jgi:hypothetical protein
MKTSANTAINRPLHRLLNGRTPDQAYFDPLPLRTAA